LQSTSAGALLMTSVDIIRSGMAFHGDERIATSLEAATQVRRDVIKGGQDGSFGRPG
jgi:hypothetical protein